MTMVSSLVIPILFFSVQAQYRSNDHTFADNIRAKSTIIFNNFLVSFTPSSLSLWAKDTMLPRAISCIETLPSLSRSGRESELIAAIRLVTAYLKALIMIGTRSDKSEKSASHLRSFIVTQLATEEIRQYFVGKKLYGLLYLEDFGSYAHT